MKLYFMRQDVLDYLKSHIGQYINYYENEDNSWIYEITSDPFLEYKMEVKEFDLVLDNIYSGETDLKNTKIIHSNLRNINRTEASDERLWAGLNHTLFWKYIYLRFKRLKNISEKDIINRYFFNYGYSEKRAILHNTTARLWWAGEQSYLEGAKDPYYLLHSIENSYITNIFTLYSSKFSNNKTVLSGFLKGLLRYRDSGNTLTIEVFRDMVKSMNLIGGSYLLDYLREDEIEELVYSLLEKRKDIYGFGN